MEWQLLRNQLLATQKDYQREVNDELARGNSHKAAQISGKVQMIDEIIDLPDYMLALQRSKEVNGHASQD